MDKARLISLVALGAGIAATASGPVRAEDRSLYERLGGASGIAAVVDDLTSRAAADPKVNFLRAGRYATIDIPRFNRQMVDFIAAVTGGPQRYTGRDMRTVHKSMGISDPEFDAMAADLQASLEKLKVPAQERNELLKIIASTRSDIVEVKREVKAAEKTEVKPPKTAVKKKAARKSKRRKPGS